MTLQDELRRIAAIGDDERELVAGAMGAPYLLGEDDTAALRRAADALDAAEREIARLDAQFCDIHQPTDETKDCWRCKCNVYHSANDTLTAERDALREALEGLVRAMRYWERGNEGVDHALATARRLLEEEE